jgi:DNA-directed RNA polymerase subunit RPC12/RpoP
MSRYIDADALLERILKLRVSTDDLYGMGITRGIERAETAIEMQPTADVVEVRHGEWRTAIEYNESRVTECSACHKEFYFMKKGQLNIDKMNFCPNCGAKMDGRREENEQC